MYKHKASSSEFQLARILRLNTEPLSQLQIKQFWVLGFHCDSGFIKMILEHNQLKSYALIDQFTQSKTHQTTAGDLTGTQ